MKYIYTTILVVLFVSVSQLSQAQPSKQGITGAVHDQSGKPLPGATVVLLRMEDSVLVKSAITDKYGNYELELTGAGAYLLRVSATGYETVYHAMEHTADTVPDQLPVMKLRELVKKLEGVTVTSKRSFIEAKADKTVVNVDASPTSAGATALEILEKSPGIMVNNDGAVSLRGKSGVIIMLDGKPSYLSPADLANLLKNMPASAIDQIEIMTNPSSRFDASGNAGVINIKTKKGKTAGFNGSVMAGVTTSLYKQDGVFFMIPKSQNSINFNYRKNKINFFGNYNPNINRGRAALQIDRTVLDGDKTVLGFNDVETRFKFGNNNHTLKLGLDYTPDKRNSFGVVVSGFTFAGHPTPVTETTSSDATGQPLSTMVSQTDNRLNFRNFTSNLNYRHVFDSTGRELTADADLVVYDNTSTMGLTTAFFDGNGQSSSSPLLLRGHLPASIRIWSFKSDYIYPLSKDSRIEAGVKSSIVNNDNLVDYQRWDNSKWVEDARSNHFIYDENINAAYINASAKAGKWSGQGGLRIENTNAKGYQVTNDSTFRRHWTNLFPSAFLGYKADDNNLISLSYSRRITRPNYQDLNPFIYFLDSLSYRKGNPFLLPQFTHNLELSHTFNSKLVTTLNYNFTSDVISQILKADGNLVFLTSENVSRFRNTGIAVTAPVAIAKWWNLNLFVNVFNNKYDGVYNGKPLKLDYTSYMLNMTQSFTIKKGFTAELSGFYRARGVDQLSINDPMYVINMGAQKQVLKGKGTMRLNLRDPFWLQRYSGRTEYDVILTRIRNRWDNRQITFSMTYRFGKPASNNTPRRRNNASQDEQNRIGQGGQ